MAESDDLGVLHAVDAEAPLRDCPFCGSSDIALLEWSGDGSADGSRMGVRCAGCGACTAFRRERLAALAAWNVRVEPT